MTATTTKNRQIVIQLPEGMPRPKFEMFQRVRYYNSVGYIIGVYWIDDSTALMERVDPGWHYMTSRIYGMTDTNEILSTRPDQEMMPEEEVSAA